MNKFQIALLVSGFFLVVLLYAQPKFILQNADTKEASAASEAEAPSQMSEQHANVLDEEDFKSINALRNSYLSVQSKEKKLTFADSLAETFEKLSKFDSAAKYREEIVLLDPTERHVLMAAETYANAFSFASSPSQGAPYNDKARNLYKKVLDRHPDNLDIKSRYAMTFVSTQNPMQGIMLMREILEKNPNHESTIFNLGTLAMQSGQKEKAQERFVKLVQINPQNWRAQFYLGVVLFELGKQAEAKDKFNLVLKNDLDPFVQTTAKEYLQKIN